MEYFIQNELKNIETASTSSAHDSKEHSAPKEYKKETQEESKSYTPPEPAVAPNSAKVMLITKCPHVNRKHYAKV